ncbi:macrophage mannose receptor 1-like [Branchiostoma floridae x Branchiostoma belcheri]
MINPIYAPGSADPPMDKPQTDHQARANDAKSTPEVTYATIPDDPPMDQPQARANDDENTPDATIPDGAYPGGVSGRRGVCSFLRARRSCPAAGIAVLLGLVAVGLAPLTFSNKQEISQLSTTMKRDMHQLATTVNALKCDQGDMCKLFAAVDALKLDLDNERNRSATLEHRLKDDMSTAVDALKRDLDNERNRSATLEQRLLKIEKSFLLKIEKSLLCPKGYTLWRGTCYKAFDTLKTFTEAAAACRADGGTLAIPRDAETDAFLISLYKSVHEDCSFWFGLHYQQKEERFEWVDGSALGPYRSWAPGEPDKFPDGEDCVFYTTSQKWNDHKCHHRFSFICQNTQVSCPEGYTKLREICYKAFINTRKTFSDAAAACRADGGTLAMPRDARTNAFLSTLYNSVRDDRRFWLGLHDQREEERFEWVDGSALGPYSSWAPGEPNNLGCCDDCVIYSARKKDKWNDEECNETFRFICQAAPEPP